MSRFLRGMFGGSSKRKLEVESVLHDPLGHITAVSSNPEYGVIRVTTDLERSDKRHAKDLADIANAIGQEAGHPARAIAQLNEVQLIGVPASRLEEITECLQDRSWKNEREQGKLTPHQADLLGKLRPQEVTSTELTLPNTGEPITVFKLPIDTSIRALGPDSGSELAALVDTLLKEKNFPVTNVAYDGSEGGMLRVHVAQRIPAERIEATKATIASMVEGQRQIGMN